jgi:hypothetical protein
MLPGGSIHGAELRPSGVVNTSKPLQTEFPFLASMPTPALATREELLRVTDEAHAVRISLGNKKRCWVARTLGISAGMLSLCCKSTDDPTKRRRIADAKLYAFCVLTGTQLLKQYRERLEREAELDGDRRAIERRQAASLSRAVVA